MACHLLGAEPSPQSIKTYFLLTIRPLGTNFSEIWIKLEVSFSKMHLICHLQNRLPHYSDIIMSTMASQITSVTIVYSTVYSGTDQRKHQSSISLAFVQGIHWWPVNSPHKGPVTRKMFPFDEVIMNVINSNFTFYRTCKGSQKQFSNQHFFHYLTVAQVRSSHHIQMEKKSRFLTNFGQIPLLCLFQFWYLRKNIVQTILIFRSFTLTVKPLI